MLLVTFLAVVGMLYFVVCMKSRHPEYALYGFVLVWAFFPKFIGNLPLLGAMPYEGWHPYDQVELIAALTLLCVCLFRGRRGERSDGHLAIRLFLALFLAMTAASAVSGVLLADWAAVVNYRDTAILYYIRGSLWLAYGAIFAWGCLLFLDSRRKVEGLFACFVLCGLYLTADVVLLYYLHLVPALDPWVRDSAVGVRFASLSFLSFDAVGLVSIPAIAMTLYFAVTRRSPVFYGLAALMLLPILGTLQKAPLTGAVITIAAILIYTGAPRVRAAAMFTVLAMASVSVMGQLDLMVGSVNEALGGASRPRFAESGENIAGRLALWLRGVDVVVDHFPVGVGNGMVPYHFEQGVPPYFDGLTTGSLRELYQWQAFSPRVTNSHNMFIEFAAEHGALGIAVLIGFVVLILRRSPGLRRPSPDDTDAWWPFVARVSLFGSLIGLSWAYLYQVEPKLVFLFLGSLVLAYRLASWQRRAVVAARQEDGRRGVRMRPLTSDPRPVAPMRG